MTRIGPVIALAVLLIAAVVWAARTPVHAKAFCLFCPPHHVRPHVAARDSATDIVRPRDPAPASDAKREFDPNFCFGVIKAFDTLHPKDLDTFIFSIPEDRREQARRCMTDRK